MCEVEREKQKKEKKESFFWKGKCKTLNAEEKSFKGKGFQAWQKNERVVALTEGGSGVPVYQSGANQKEKKKIQRGGQFPSTTDAPPRHYKGGKKREKLKPKKGPGVRGGLGGGVCRTSASYPKEKGQARPSAVMARGVGRKPSHIQSFPSMTPQGVKRKKRLSKGAGTKNHQLTNSASRRGRTKGGEKGKGSVRKRSQACAKSITVSEGSCLRAHESKKAGRENK